MLSLRSKIFRLPRYCCRGIIPRVTARDPELPEICAQKSAEFVGWVKRSATRHPRHNPWAFRRGMLGRAEVA